MGFFGLPHIGKKSLNYAIDIVSASLKSNERPYEAQAVVDGHIADSQKFLEELKARVSKFEMAIRAYDAYLRAADKAFDEQNYTKAIEMIEEAKEANELIASNLEYLTKHDKRLK